MIEFQTENELACDQATFWEHMYFDDGYNRGVWVETLGFPHWSQRVEITDSGLQRVVEAHPLVRNAPRWLRALAGSNFRYYEEGEFDRARGQYAFRCISHALGSKVLLGGVISTEPLRPGWTRRVYRGRMEANVAGGRFIEAMGSRMVIALLAEGKDFEARFAAEAQLRQRTLDEETRVARAGAGSREPGASALAGTKGPLSDHAGCSRFAYEEGER